MKLRQEDIDFENSLIVGGRRQPQDMGEDEGAMVDEMREGEEDIRIIGEVSCFIVIHLIQVYLTHITEIKLEIN